MTSKERLLRALNLEKPDRLPATVHQWQPFHLDTYMGGITPLEAFKLTGLDAQIQYYADMGLGWTPDAKLNVAQTSDWREEIEVIKSEPDDRILHHTITTPGGTLTYKTGGD